MTIFWVKSSIILIPYRLVTYTAALKTTVHRSAPVGCTVYLLGFALAPVVEVVLYMRIVVIWILIRATNENSRFRIFAIVQ
jgi:hypothetical protein